MNISSGIQPHPVKMVLYGVEGIGKSTFASKAPDPLFIDTEGSTKDLNVKRVDPSPKTWMELVTYIQEIRNSNEVFCKTLVIDTADWAERMCIQHICDKNQKTGIEDWGYGKGYTYVYEEFGKLINALTDIVNKGINVIILAHASLRKFEQPDENGSYDRYTLKLNDSPKTSIANMIKEWADLVLFANYKTFVVDVDGKKKAQGGQRVMYTTHNPCWDAKNRDGLPEEIPFDFSSIAHVIPDFKKSVPQPTTTVDRGDFEEIIDNTAETDKPIETQQKAKPANETINPKIAKPLADLMNASGVTEKMLRETIALQGYFPESTPIENYPADFVEYVVSIWDKVLASIKENNDLPFNY